MCINCIYAITKTLKTGDGETVNVAGLVPDCNVEVQIAWPCIVLLRLWRYQAGNIGRCFWWLSGRITDAKA
ncbi:hypothetical protein [Microbulbifer sp. GL-2]|uniref:hypothetical protein n=1 Tax=Microbulbifer sp. GL-2 TaxID=2591606 RepID=UPI001164BACF|nr:hypothetical protein [Microbulbifer sp. GL-2]BBM04139.1 hypothetical protein GL2_42130 [Microbulbifer sp. GL-2]